MVQLLRESKRRVLLAALAVLFGSDSAWAIKVTTMEEVRLLPEICRSVALIRDVSRDPVPMSEHVKIYGDDFRHLHHYCWALNAEMKYFRDPRTYGGGHLRMAIGDLEYVLRNTKDPKFRFLPDVHFAMARVYLLRKERGKAIVAAQKAIELKPDYAAVYVFLSDLFERMGDSKNAAQVLETGANAVPDSKAILRRLTRYGITPPPPPEPSASAGPPTGANEPAAAPEPGAEAAQDVVATDPMQRGRDDGAGVAIPEAPGAARATSSPPSDNTVKRPNNPYCRFCP